MGVAYFGTNIGSKVPPGICARACLSPPSLLNAKSVSAVPPVYLRNVRLETMSFSLMRLSHTCCCQWNERNKKEHSFQC